jgi:hypothetical protein
MGLKDEDRTAVWLPRVVIFVGAFLVFIIQPMVGRTLLPFFGGMASVWVTCLATFQVLLLVGYFYAHMLAGKRNWVYTVHVGLLILAAVWIAWWAASDPSMLPMPSGAGLAPPVAVMLAVLALVGGPYVLLSANSSMAQVLARGRTGRTRDVYHLYAVGNAGALTGLLCYPLLVEPFFSLAAQWRSFALLTAVYAGLLWCLARSSGEPDAPATSDLPGTPPDASVPAQVWLWLALPGLSCFLLNAVTAYLTVDLSPLPLVWVVLLALFLLSYIIGFSRIGEKGVPVFGGLALLFVGLAAILLPQREGNVFFRVLWPALGLLLCGGVFLHGWLYRLRPTGAALTKYYLCGALGGALGGSFCSLLAPVLFSSVAEYPLALVLLLLAGAVCLRQERERLGKTITRYGAWGTGLALYAIVYAVMIGGRHQPILRMRSFYGALTVFQTEGKSALGEPIPFKTFNNGSTIHGIQFEPHYLRDKPTVYYAETGGGIGVTGHPAYTNGQPMRVGLVGLGIGTLACWGRTNDLYRFYEIDENTIKIATNSTYFTFLEESAAQVEIVTGDARFELKKEIERGEEKYDVLVLDAFTGDSVPYHLLTREAFALYFERLKPDGILAVHSSNWHINLAPICKAAGRAFDKSCVGSVSRSEGVAVFAAVWCFMSQQPVDLADKRVAEIDWERVRDIALPTDGKGSLLPLISPGFKLPLKGQRQSEGCFVLRRDAEHAASKPRGDGLTLAQGSEA